MPVLEHAAKPSHAEARAMYSTWNPNEGSYETCRVFLSNQSFYVIQMLIKC